MINIIKLEDVVKQIMFNNALKGHLSTSKSSFTLLKSDLGTGKKSAKLIGLFNVPNFSYFYSILPVSVSLS